MFGPQAQASVRKHFAAEVAESAEDAKKSANGYEISESIDPELFIEATAGKEESGK